MNSSLGSPEVTDGCEPPCGCWEFNSGPLHRALNHRAIFVFSYLDHFCNKGLIDPELLTLLPALPERTRTGFMITTLFKKWLFSPSMKCLFNRKKFFFPLKGTPNLKHLAKGWVNLVTATPLLHPWKTQLGVGTLGLNYHLGN